MMNLLHFIPDPLMELLKFMVFGLLKIIEKLIICLPVMVFYSTMNLQEEEKLL